MYERFTDRARRVVVFAQEEARDLNHNYIGTEHLLLGLLQEGDVVARVLESSGFSLEVARAQVRKMVGQGESRPAGHLPFTPRGRRVLEMVIREGYVLGHDYIGTEHQLLAIIRLGEGIAVEVLGQCGIELNKLRDAVLGEIHSYAEPEPEPDPEPWPASATMYTELPNGVCVTLSRVVATPDTLRQVLQTTVDLLGEEIARAEVHLQ